ncbi:MAG: hypothetical protein MJY59_01935 [Bacteroidaceae bacterium]|nr:hypothetical protein [Bacteroidaceae bacterium]
MRKSYEQPGIYVKYVELLSVIQTSPSSEDVPGVPGTDSPGGEGLVKEEDGRGIW